MACMSWSSPLNADSAEKLCDFFLSCKKRNEDAILLINSPGGDFNCLNAVISTLKATKVNLITIGRGQVASAAAVIFLMGDRRFLLDNTMLCIHRVRTYRESACQAYHAKKLHKTLEKDDKLLLSYISEKTKITKKLFEEKCEEGKDWFPTKKELKELKIVTDFSDEWVDLVLSDRK